MNEFISQNELIIRLGIFFAVLLLIALWEVLAPRRELTVSKLMRWTNNIGIVVLNSVVVRLIFPTAAVGVALFAEQHGWGLLNYYTLPYWLTVIVSVIALDFIIYLQHVLVHAIPALWRLHRVHHADMDFDVTTGARFHPLEILVSMLIKFAAIVVLGPPVIAVIIFEILLNATAMFNHGNIKLPVGLDKVLRLFIVTPDMHRVHHSVEDDETNSNFGFNLPFWDRLFGTYRAQPRAGHTEMTIGIHGFRDPKQVEQLPGMLKLPFVSASEDEYVINRRQWSKPEKK
jgi:sterol desaturase/sphingolipid hydroxylase (fatty acid hydroxylase superfamily)